MSLESATWISELDVNNPTATDVRSQGDDHFRLVKTVLKNNFPTASKAWYNPNTVAKTGAYSILASDMNKTILVDTSGGAFDLTLPSLAAGDAGWECSFIKTTTDTNAFYIKPPSGTIQSGEVSGLAKTRRCIPGHRTRVLWTGSDWIAERVVKVPVGTVLENHLASVPVGYEAAQGATLGSASTDYPDYYKANANSGVLPDHGGRVVAGLEAAATRLTAAGSGIAGNGVGNAGGAETVTLAQANLPNVTIGAGTLIVAAGQGSHTHALSASPLVFQQSGTAGGAAAMGTSTAVTATASTLPQMTVSGSTASINGGVAQTAVNKVQPTIVARKIVVVE